MELLREQKRLMMLFECRLNSRAAETFRQSNEAKDTDQLISRKRSAPCLCVKSPFQALDSLKVSGSAFLPTVLSPQTSVMRRKVSAALDSKRDSSIINNRFCSRDHSSSKQMYWCYILK
ncbi:hypothetical protein KIN20_018960 [Parelaphostrongylus tenuis]|uniref:Uncharacterized protein n=1 Tax=Parelaphostrongylus tenuis TaxID=148309 RepID=A0AAD5N4A9_PARTN|nr:hypothetical protein KIN20_018960 [Parelaphostrongylus tenuis]